MILQDVLFPNVETCSVDDMYFRDNSANHIVSEKYYSFDKNASLSSFSYFNGFSIGKWKKYTILNNLKLRLTLDGDFVITIKHARMMSATIKNEVVAEKSVSTNGICDVEIAIPVNRDAGIYFFELKSFADGGKLYSGAYETEIDEKSLPEVKIAIDICTFRREPFVEHNMDVLNRYVLQNPENDMFGHLEVFISDNGKTLNVDKLSTDLIHVFPNKNLGGAGGFTRSMIEIMKVAKERNVTHIMMMDDDIRLNPHSIFRTYKLLKMLKPDYKDAFVGGHMLKLDSPTIQSEAADHWDISTHHPVKYNYDLTIPEMLAKNEVEDSVNYLSWWYCCMPINVPTENNLPLPIFIKRDDIEYGLRNGKTFITMNGICVWHEPFEYKYATYLEYYYFRNLCIMNAKHRASFNKKRLIKEIKKRIKELLLRYRFKDAELNLLGIQHYLKGVDWFKSLDGEKLNAEIMKLGYKKVPVENIGGFVFTHGIYEKNIQMQKPGKREFIKRALTLNGWLLKAKHNNVVVPAYQPKSHLFYRAKRVINYEEATNTAFVTTKSFRSLFYILRMRNKTIRLIRRKFNKVTAEFRNRYAEFTNLSFWQNYLFNQGYAPEIKSGLTKYERPKNTREQKKKLFLSRVLKFVQACLFWLPMKKKRVMFYAHDRKGFTCNPKYVALELVKQYGDKAEIIWVSSYPETCEEVKKLGIEVVKSGSTKEFIKYLRAKFFITNDAFPAWALHKPNQKWMNTWHGAMNYKHIGYDYLMPMSKAKAKLFKTQNRQPDFYLSGSQFFLDDTSVSFRLDKKVFLPTGLPRNDVFFSDYSAIADKVRKHYGIEKGVKTVLFAPTFRVGMKSSTFGLDFDKICNALSNRFGGKWIVLFRNHNFVKAKANYSGAIDVSGYYDMQELMCLADVLISDYSSCLYDFCFTGKPSFVYATDVENYMKNERSFAYPIDKWPYSIANSNDSLVKNIVAFDEKSFAENIKEHLIDCGAFDNGSASKQAVDIIKKYCFKN